MIEKEMNLWDAPPGAWIGIPTNGAVKSDGRLVMGAGVARQARDRYPGLAAELGRLVRQNGNVVLFSWKSAIFTFPTKRDWREPADLDLIKNSAGQLASHIQVLLKTFAPPSDTFYLPRPGCGLGGLRWGDVRPVIDFLPDNVVIAHQGGC